MKSYTDDCCVDVSGYGGKCFSVSCLGYLKSNPVTNWLSLLCYSNKSLFLARGLNRKILSRQTL